MHIHEYMNIIITVQVGSIRSWRLLLRLVVIAVFVSLQLCHVQGESQQGTFSTCAKPPYEHCRSFVHTNIHNTRPSTIHVQGMCNILDFHCEKKQIEIMMNYSAVTKMLEHVRELLDKLVAQSSRLNWKVDKI